MESLKMTAETFVTEFSAKQTKGFHASNLYTSKKNTAHPNDWWSSQWACWKLATVEMKTAAWTLNGVNDMKTRILETW